jgi:MFS superfamily sulfate permease-like transporter
VPTDHRHGLAFACSRNVRDAAALAQPTAALKHPTPPAAPNPSTRQSQTTQTRPHQIPERSGLGVLPGIAIAVAVSVAEAFRRSWWPYQTQLGRAAGLPGYHDLRSYPDAELLPGLVVFRFDAPLFFANARTFREQIRKLASAEPRPRWILVAAEPITDVDTTAADMLEDLDEAINAKGVALVFAEMKDPVRAKLERYGLTQTIDPRHFFPTLDAAIAAFREETGADWTRASRP